MSSCASAKNCSTGSSVSRDDRAELLVVPVALGERLLEDRRVRGHADDGVLLHQAGELARLQHLARERVHPDAHAVLAQLVQSRSAHLVSLARVASRRRASRAPRPSPTVPDTGPRRRTSRRGSGRTSSPASDGPTTSEPRQSTFMSSCSTPWCAEYTSWQIAARIPGIFEAAIDAPTPEPQTSTPRSARPPRIAAADVAREVGVVDAHGVGLDAEVDDLVARGLDRVDAPPRAAARRGGRTPTATFIAALRYAIEGSGTTDEGAAMDDRELWRELGQQLRVDAVRASAKAGSGHPTSSMSAADLAAVLLAAHLRYDFDDPHDPRERPARLLEGPRVAARLRAVPRRRRAHARRSSARTASSAVRLEGHPVPVLPWVDVATGSLGQGLPIGVGMAIAGKRLNRLPFRVWVICGDSEMAEGSMWEAAEHAAFYELDNLDRDRRRQPARPARRDHARLGPLLVHAALRGVRLARDRDRRARRRGDRRRLPRGRGDDRPADGDRRAHDQGQGLLEGRERERLARQGDRRGGDRGARRASATSRSTSRKPEPGDVAPVRRPSRSTWPAYEVGTQGLDAQGVRRGARGARRRATATVVALDGEVSNSTFAEIFAKAHPERFVEMYIAEQQMVAAAVGMQVLGWKPFCSTFAAFLSAARTTSSAWRAVSRRDAQALRLARRRLDRRGRPVADGARGPRRVPRDPRLDRALPVRRQPDGRRSSARWRTSTASRTSARRAGTRPSSTRADETFPVGGSKTLRDGDDVAIVAAGITLHEALSAADALAEEGISARVIDCYSVKPIDGETLAALADADRDRRGPLGGGRSRRGRALGARASRRATARVTRARGARAAAVGQAGASCSPPRGSTPTHIAEAARALVTAAVGVV